jgi:hypothetical protein
VDVITAKLVLPICFPFGLILSLSLLAAIPEASASLTAIRPIPSQIVDQGTRPALTSIQISSSFLNPFDIGDTVRLSFTSNSIPPSMVSFLPNPVRVARDNPIATVGLQVRSDGFSPGAYGFRVQAVDEDTNTVSSPGCLIIRPTNQTSCPPPPPGPPAQQQPSRPTSPPIYSSPPAQLPSFSLTGMWRADDGGTYYLRQIGNILWWNGMSGGNDGFTFNNVFRGTITSSTNTITGEWADVPRGTVMGYGTLNLKVVSSTLVQKVSQAGSGFGATTWQKLPDRPVVR